MALTAPTTPLRMSWAGPARAVGLSPVSQAPGWRGLQDADLSGALAASSRGSHSRRAGSHPTQDCGSGSCKEPSSIDQSGYYNPPWRLAEAGGFASVHKKKQKLKATI